jgi:hypothetical protein
MMGTRRTTKPYGCLLIIVSPADPRAPSPDAINNTSVGSGGRKSKTSQSGDIVEQGLEEGAFKVVEGWGYLRWAGILVFPIGVYGDVMMCGTSA